MSDIHTKTLQHPGRLAILHDLQVFNIPLPPSLDGLPNLAARLLNASTALVSIVDADRQFFLSSVGVREPWATLRQTPLSYSFCQYVVTNQQPLVVNDARVHPLVRDSLAVSELGVIAYAGMPLLMSSGHVLGSFAVVDDKVREWGTADLTLLNQFAAIIITELERRYAEQACKRAEAQVAQLRDELALRHESERLLADGIAHNFNNLLGGILGNAELALSDLPPNAQANITPIIDLTHRASRLTRQMLTFTAKPSIQLVALDLRDTVLDFLAQFRRTVSPNIVVRDDVAAQLPQIHGDSGKLTELLVHLLTNAVEALGDAGGEITLSVSAEQCDCYTQDIHCDKPHGPSGMYVNIAVQDTGIGMNAEIYARMFEPFFSTKFVGRGLGLPAVRGIVQSHAGAINVCSAPNQGTTVTCMFPVAHDDSASKQQLTHTSLQIAS